MIKPEYEKILQQLMNQELTVSELSDERCRLVLRYLILKLRLKF
jgi:hypothetical protein